MKYNKITLEQFYTKLNNSEYVGVTGARRAVGKMYLTGQTKKAAHLSIDKHFAEDGSVLSTPKQATSQDLATLRSSLLAFKESTRAGWEVVAATCGVDRLTLRRLMHTDKCSSETIRTVQEGLQKLDALPTQLERAGFLTPSPTPAQKKVPIPSPEELDALRLNNLLQIQAVLDRMLQRPASKGKRRR